MYKTGGLRRVFDAVVLAGTGKQSTLTLSEGIGNKALIDIHGQPLLAYVLKALRSSDLVDRIAVVGPAAELTQFIEPFRILIVEEAGSITDNIAAGYQALQPGKHFLITSADIPFLSKESVDEFLEQCMPYDVDFYYPIVSKHDSDTCFPDTKRTYAKLKDGIFTGGNIFLVNPAKLDAGLPRINKFFAARKSPLKLLLILGIGFIFKFATGNLTIKELEDSLPRLIGLSGKAIRSRHPEISTDVDKICDLELARRKL